MRKFINTIGPNIWGWMACLYLLCVWLSVMIEINTSDMWMFLISTYCMMLWGKDREIAKSDELVGILAFMLSETIEGKMKWAKSSKPTKKEAA